MRLSKTTKMIARSAFETFQKRDLETQNNLIKKWKDQYESNNMGTFSEDGWRAVPLILRVLTKERLK